MKQVRTFSEYMNDETRVTSAEKEKINYEIDIIGKATAPQEEHCSKQKTRLTSLPSCEPV